AKAVSFKWSDGVDAARAEKDNSARPAPAIFKAMVQAHEICHEKVVWRSVLPSKHARFGGTFDEQIAVTFGKGSGVADVPMMEDNTTLLQTLDVELGPFAVQVVHADDANSVEGVREIKGDIRSDEPAASADHRVAHCG